MSFCHIEFTYLLTYLEKLAITQERIVPFAQNVVELMTRNATEIN